MNEAEYPLDLHDIQGNIVKAYPRFGFPKARYFFFRVNDGAGGRQFLRDLLPMITTSAPWSPRGSEADGTAIPEVATNVAFTYDGLWRLGVPQASLQSFPEEFAMGMRARAEILGDEGKSAPERWDPIWRGADPVHIFVAINAATSQGIEKAYQQVVRLAQAATGVELLSGHAGPGAQLLPYQDASAIYVEGQPTPKEHFGYTDGISGPFFKGALTDSSNVIGGGKVTGGNVESMSGWAPLETGEFLLGHKDEALEYPAAPIPSPLADNGTFMVYRKLHQNVGSFDAYLDHVGREYPAGKEGLAAKFAGRWRNGAPLATFPTEAEASAFALEWGKAKQAVDRAKNRAERALAKRKFAELNVKFVAFDYRNDIDGARCPVGAHARRAHPRAALEYGVTGAFETPDALANRRRIIRRGLPYGDSSERKDEGEHGIAFMALGASIRRQFEFVQQQWLNYSNDFRRGNDKDPLIGNQPVSQNGTPAGRMLIETAPDDPRPPFMCSKLPRFVETRGGDYFFVPSMTALRMIADGLIDPT